MRNFYRSYKKLIIITGVIVFLIFSVIYSRSIYIDPRNQPFPSSQLDIEKMQKFSDVFLNSIADSDYQTAFGMILPYYYDTLYKIKSPNDFKSYFILMCGGELAQSENRSWYFYSRQGVEFGDQGNIQVGEMRAKVKLKNGSDKDLLLRIIFNLIPGSFIKPAITDPVGIERISCD